MRTFIKYSQNKFERELIRIRINNGLLSWKEITESFNQKHGEPISLEHIYSFPTRNRFVQIVIFSSVDTRNHQSRNKNTDAVRVIYEWSTRKGPIYKRIDKHLRINTLFINLEKTIILASKQYDLGQRVTGFGWSTFDKVEQ